MHAAETRLKGIHPHTPSLHDGTEPRGEVGEGGGRDRGQGRLPHVGRDAPQGRGCPPPILRQGVGAAKGPVVDLLDPRRASYADVRSLESWMMVLSFVLEGFKSDALGDGL